MVSLGSHWRRIQPNNCQLFRTKGRIDAKFKAMMLECCFNCCGWDHGMPQGRDFKMRWIWLHIFQPCDRLQPNCQNSTIVLRSQALVALLSLWKVAGFLFKQTSSWSLKTSWLILDCLPRFQGILQAWSWEDFLHPQRAQKLLHGLKLCDWQQAGLKTLTTVPVPAHQHRDLQARILFLHWADLVLFLVTIDLLCIHLFDRERFLSHGRFRENQCRMPWRWFGWPRPKVLHSTKIYET